MTRRATGDDFLHSLLEQRGSDTAWSAPPAGLIDEEIGELQRDIEHIASRPKDHGRSASRKVLIGDAPGKFPWRDGPTGGPLI